MNSGLQRRLAIKLCGLALLMLPRRFHSWAFAIRAEIAAIEDDSEALRFALSSLIGIAPNAMADLFASISADRFASSGRSSTMNFWDSTTTRPHATGIFCAIGATMLGIAYMAMGGAPYSYLGVNFGALVIGLVMLAAIGKVARTFQRWSGPAIAIFGLSLLATALMGAELDGVSRWVKIGSLSVQPGLVLVPMMTVWFVRSQGPLATLGMIAAAVALAIQPDRAMAAALAAGTVALLFGRRDLWTVAAALSGIASFLLTMSVPDPMPAMAYVDQIIFRSFDIGLLSGSAVIGGLALLMLPAMFGLRHDSETRTTSLVFATTWLTMITAAALGNYPTPVVGYSGGAVLGYVLSLTIFSIIERSSSHHDNIMAEASSRTSQQNPMQQFATA